MTSAIEVLIVEDDVRIAEIHRRFLDKVGGFQMTAIANSGQEAKDYLDVLKPQLVLLDVYLPDMKGMDLIWYIRQYHKEMDIIMITAAGEGEMIREALRGGVVDYLIKPVMFQRFAQTLGRYREQMRLTDRTRLNQAELDRWLWRAESEEKRSAEVFPKGIDPVTLGKVLRTVTSMSGKGVTTEEVAVKVGVSRTTARRYLEFLVSSGRLKADLSYGSVGRPERKYMIKS
ncbi:response regulator [Laceyella putida]|uniref:Transcriptional regulatory protein n=1 Tax=Laceyella putida TaxID=110101 RepID=A0ABW2RP57_9BACL